METWRPIKDFPMYDVSDSGSVRNRKRGRLIAAHPSRTGYLHVGLYNGEKRINKYVHRLVAEAFLTDCNDSLEVNHIDGVKSNNSVSNLEMCTSSENCIHAYKNGLRHAPNSPYAQRVQIVETGDIYDSIRKCAKSINGERKSIISCLNGKQRTHKGMHFRRISERD